MRLIRVWFNRAKQDLAGLPPSTRIFVVATIAAEVVLAAVLAVVVK